MVAAWGMGKLRHGGILLQVQVFSGAVGPESWAKWVQPLRPQLWSPGAKSSARVKRGIPSESGWPPHQGDLKGEFWG